VLAVCAGRGRGARKPGCSQRCGSRLESPGWTAGWWRVQRSAGEENARRARSRNGVGPGRLAAFGGALQLVLACGDSAVEVACFILVHALVELTGPRRSPRVLTIGCRTVEAAHHHYGSTSRQWYTCHKAHFPIYRVSKLPCCPKPCTRMFSAWLTQTACTPVGAAATRIMNLACGSLTDAHHRSVRVD
jgi:hypothetical protein